MIVALVAVLLISAVATGTYLIWQLVNGHADPPPKPTPSISPSSSALRTPASTRSAAPSAAASASSRPIHTGAPSTPAETVPAPEPEPAEPARSQPGPAVSPSRSLSAAFDVRVKLDPDRVTLHVVILGAPPGSLATTAIDGHRCGRPVEVPPSGMFDVDSRGCGDQRFGDARLARVAVTAGGRPIGHSIIEVEEILDNPRKAVRGIVTGLLGGR